MRLTSLRVSVGSWLVSTALIVGGCAARASVGPAPASAASAGAPQPPPAPATAEACKACHGLWAKHGIAQSESCNCRTTDAGKRCKDGAECQGVCVAADEPEREVVDPGPPPRGYFVGKCSETVAVFGCFKPIDKGAAAQGPLPLVEPPPSLCAD